MGVIQFKQSCADFPLMVKLGEKVPSWGLSRWGGKKGLRFVPPDDEGFTLRGDKRRLLYKGRRRSHRFTILGDTAFEYDCILNGEPESNVISLRMEGAENFDFFRQPDFVTEPFLKGSYAVYKKETLIGEGTGKLCHIHRPEIIDARGRRCWGDLAVVGNELHITVPEKWLGEAKYPVVVDPTVGTTTIGSQTTGPDPDNPAYDRPMLDAQFSLVKLAVAQNGGGACRAYIYAYYDDTDSYVQPCLYTNNNNKPYARKSLNENQVNVLAPPAGWRSNTFEINGMISVGEYVWFGVAPTWFTTRFDYGGECYKFWHEFEDELPSYLQIGPSDTFCDIKWSWYFTCEAITSQNYTRTLSQGAALVDNHTLITNYKRRIEQTAGINEISSFVKKIYLKCLEVAGSITEISKKALFTRCQTEAVKTWDFVKRGLLLFIHITTVAFIRDYLLGRLLRARKELAVKSTICCEIVIESKIN